MCHLRAAQTGVISELFKLVSSQSCSHWCFLIFSSSALFYTVTVRTSSGNVTSSPVTVIIPGACCLCTPGYNLYIRTYVPTYIHTCMHTYAYIRAYTHIHTYILYIRLYVLAYTYNSILELSLNSITLVVRKYVTHVLSLWAIWGTCMVSITSC